MSDVEQIAWSGPGWYASDGKQLVKVADENVNSDEALQKSGEMGLDGNPIFYRRKTIQMRDTGA